MAVSQTMPPEVRDIIAWLRSERFDSGGWSCLRKVADMIENGDPCLDDMTPWDARLRAKRRAAARSGCKPE